MSDSTETLASSWAWTEGGVATGWLTMLLNVLFDEALFIYLVDNALTVGDEGSHCFGDGEVS